MFNNLINLHDFVTLAGKMRERGMWSMLAKLSSGSQGRVERTWMHAPAAPRNWWDIPAVERRWNALLTGDPGLDLHRYVAEKYLPERGGLHGLSLGCGAGGRELRWAATGRFRRLDGYDCSAGRIAAARLAARESGLDEVLGFVCGDVFDLAIPPGTYDVILAEGSLHHFAPVRLIMERIAGWLRPGGLFIVNEYIGPSRFQWSSRQLEIVNALLDLLPPGYRSLPETGRRKSRVHRPGRLSMYMHDPSEAAESALIPGLLPELFRVAEGTLYGGTLLQLLFKDIAHNFLADDEVTRRLLRLCFDAEDILLKCGDIRSDFGFFVCTGR